MRAGGWGGGGWAGWGGQGQDERALTSPHAENLPARAPQQLTGLVSSKFIDCSRTWGFRLSWA